MIKSVTCKHCGHPIQKSDDYDLWYHPTVIGFPGGLGRCQEDMTRYGYNAEPVGQPCANPCLGDVQPDPNERTE